MKKIKKIFLIITILINVSILSFAHPGRTDSNGGHYNRKTGEYHYHDGRYSGQTIYTPSQNNTTNVTSQTFSPSLKDSLVQNKINKNTEDVYQPLKKVDKSSDWDTLLYVSIFAFFIMPLGVSLLVYIVELIKKLFIKIFKNK